MCGWGHKRVGGDILTVPAFQKYGVQTKLNTVKVLRRGEGKEKKEPYPHQHHSTHTLGHLLKAQSGLDLPSFQLLNIPLFLHGIISHDQGLHTTRVWVIYIQCELCILAVLCDSSTSLSLKPNQYLHLGAP